MPDTKELLDQSVDTLKEDLPEYDGDLEALLEKEKEGENRKTAKQAIKNEMERRHKKEGGEEDEGMRGVKDRVSAALEGGTVERERVPMEKMKTGIPGLNQVLNGGIPRENLVLLTGPPGAGKTTGSIQFLVDGMENGERCVFLTLNTREEKVKQYAQVFGWDLERYEEEDLLDVIRPPLYKWEALKNRLTSAVLDWETDRLVIDSFTVLQSYFESDLELRRKMKSLAEVLDRGDTTSVATAGIGSVANELQEYVVDGVIRLYLKRVQDTFKRGVAVKKMRGTDHSHTVHPLQITGDGLRVFPDQKLFTQVD